MNNGLELAELEQESVELLPNRQTLSAHRGGRGSLDLGLGLGLELGLGLGLGVSGHGH